MIVVQEGQFNCPNFLGTRNIVWASRLLYNTGLGIGHHFGLLAFVGILGNNTCCSAFTLFLWQ